MFGITVNADGRIVAAPWSRFRVRIGSIFGRDLFYFFGAATRRPGASFSF